MRLSPGYAEGATGTHGCDATETLNLWGHCQWGWSASTWALLQPAHKIDKQQTAATELRRPRKTYLDIKFRWLMMEVLSLSDSVHTYMLIDEVGQYCI